MTTSFGGETALSLTRQMAAAIPTPAAGPIDDTRKRIRAVFGIEMPRGEGLASRVLAMIRKPGYRAEQVEFTSDREIRIPGWLLTPDAPDPSTPTVLHIGEAAAWGSVAEDGFAERLCTKGGCRVASNRPPRTRRLRHRVPAARSVLLSKSHHQRGLPHLVHVDARQAAPRRTGVRQPSSVGLSRIAAGRTSVAASFSSATARTA